ncbi:MAG: hypothetical protein FJ288_16955 [Planctomycetes bacterium]|nr:hypothetical protein [Planctomycetota bacterium]
MRKAGPWTLVLPALLAAAAAAAGESAPPSPGQGPAAPGRSPAANLVANGDFSQVEGGRPVGWKAEGDAAVEQALFAARDAEGRPVARLACTRFDARSPASHAMLAQAGVRLDKGRLYEFSCRTRADGLRGGAVQVALQDTRRWANTGLHLSMPAGPAWQTHKQFFIATQDVGPESRLQFWFAETGTLEVADVRLAEAARQEVEFADLAPPPAGKNHVYNGSFELGGAGWGSQGQGAGWGDLAALHGAAVTGDAVHGRAFLRIPLGGDRTPLLHFDYLEPIVRRELRPLAASLGWIRVEKGQAYTLSCHLRASAEGTPALLGVRQEDTDGRGSDLLTPIALTQQWKLHQVTFTPARGYVFVLVGPNLPRDERVEVDIDAVQLEKGREQTLFEPRAPVEIALEPAEPGGFFVAGRQAVLLLRAANRTAERVRTQVRLEAADFDDRIISLPPVVLEVPPQGAIEHRVTLPLGWRGYYRVRASVPAGTGAESAERRVAVVPAPAGDDTVLGVNHAFASAELVRLARLAGVAWFRDWSLKWQTLEPAPGQYRWEAGDAQVDRVVREGARLVCLLPPFPSADWSSEAPDGLPTKGYPGVRLRQAWGPKDPALMGAFIEKAASRYKDRVRTWEFLNEPIYTDYALPADRTSRYGGRKYAPADYVALLEVAAAAMRRADPACRIIGGIGGGPNTLTREVIQAGCLKHADILNLHMYPGRRKPEAYWPEMDALLSLMDAGGGRKPIWITEFAYYGADDLPRRPFIPHGGWAEERLLADERQCAAYTVRFAAVMLSRGTEKVFLHSGASARVNRPNLECVLFGYGGSPRKVAPALAVLADLLGPAPKFAGERALGDGGHAVAFEAQGRSVMILWHENDGPREALTLPAAARCLDLMGCQVPAASAAISPCPIYLVGPPGRAKELLEAVHPGRAN